MSAASGGKKSGYCRGGLLPFTEAAALSGGRERCRAPPAAAAGCRASWGPPAGRTAALLLMQLLLTNEAVVAMARLEACEDQPPTLGDRGGRLRLQPGANSS